MQDVFEKARKDMLYPPIGLTITDGDVCKLEFSRKHRLVIGRDFARKFSEKGLLGAFHHALNHWAKHPYDLKTIILESFWLRNYENGNEIRELFDDVVANLDLVVNRGLDAIAETYRELPVEGEADALLRAYFSEITGLDFGKFELSDELERRLSVLLKIDFLDRRKLKSNIQLFAELFSDLDISLPFENPSLDDFSKQEIERALAEIAKDVDLEEFEEISKFLGISGGEGKQRRADVEWYRHKASRYVVYIESSARTGSLYPNELVDFSLDDAIDFYSPIESYGKIIPGIAKKYEAEEFEGQSSEARNAVIIIDSSGSMKNPQKCSYAVLGAFAIARSYMDMGGKVGVINFSGRSIEVPPSRGNDVYEALAVYQGGGTRLDVEKLKSYVEKYDCAECDFILITDAGIENIEEAVAYLSSLRSLTVIWIREYAKDVEDFRKRSGRLKGIAANFIEVEDERDIPKIVIRWRKEE
ncbi:VWA domain-containing protein [Archaeoglobus veneficus]|uniref:VWA domain-containing protein n=1 Tax=Archaeoglobus veneficus (strain DSM 11195 / SNP6) TaxID=693661 RepID=F2KRC2_ARCVS|nr:VWA domain-containing protein [Archaeoglobus veneficus]AEA47856.1 hypothetical protein Arcve_1861 [Archaeoglobus veneficus SNP6]